MTYIFCPRTSLIVGTARTIYENTTLKSAAYKHSDVGARFVFADVTKQALFAAAGRFGRQNINSSEIV